MSQTTKSMRILAAALMAGGPLMMWGGCQSPPTEIVSGMTTQLQVPRYLKNVGVVVQRSGRILHCEVYQVFDGQVTLPSTLGSIPAEEGELAEPITIQVLGFASEDPPYAADCIGPPPEPGTDGQGVLVLRRRRLTYASDRIVYLPMPLRESCADKACPDDQTCIGGECEPMEIDSSTLVDYRDDLIFGNTNTCFSVSRCMPLPLTVPAVLVDPDTCTFDVPWPADAPAPAPGQLNVELVYNSFGTEILDLDDKEGFVLPDIANPLRFRLADNLCNSNYKPDPSTGASKILSVRASALCSAKRPLQPICDDDLADIQAGGRVPQPGQTELCTVGDPLVPTESALYVLMDSSSSMGQFIGEESFQFAVQTPLSSPVAARTQLALKFLPAGAAECTAPNSFETPDIGFGLVDSVRSEIAGAVGDVANLQPDDPDLFLDAAMSGAYGALASVTPFLGGGFNRKALVIIGNRDFVARCGGNNPPFSAPSAQAQAALTGDGIVTYAVVLEPPPAATLVGDPQGDAAAIAVAGGTQVYDAVADEEEGAKAVGEIINDLGSCVYDRPADLPANLDAVALSYLDPLRSERFDIAREPACDEQNLAASGWNVAGNTLRICGADCDRLRQVLNDVTLFHAAQGQPSTPVPVVVTAPCEG